MAVERNAIYRYEKSRIRLDFVLGDVIYLSNPSIISLPFDCILNSVTLKRAFDNDFPFGMQLSDIFEIEFDYLVLKQWNADFAEALEEGFGNAKNFYLGWDGQETKSFHIPNSVKIYLDGTLIFWGFQEKKPETEYSLKNNQVVLKLTFIDAFRTCLEKFTIREVIWDFTKVKTINDCKIIDYEFSIENFAMKYWQHWSQRVNFISWNELKNRINETASYLFYAFSRQNTIGIQLNWDISTYFLPGWKFYKSKKDSARMEKDQTLQKSDIYVIWEIYEKNKVIGGFGTQTITAWDFLKKVAENFIQKAYFIYTGSNLEIYFEPFLKNQSWAAFDSQKIGKEITIRKNKNWLGILKQQNEEAFEFDFQTIEHQNSSTEAEKSLEIEILFSNACLGNENIEGENLGENKYNWSIYRKLINPKGLYYFDDDIPRKVSDQCHFSYYGDSSLPEELIFYYHSEFPPLLAYRYQKSMHEIINKAIENRMMQTGNFEIEFDYMDIIPYLGKKISYSIAHLSWGLQYPIIVNTEIDLYKEATKVKLYCWKNATD